MNENTIASNIEAGDFTTIETLYGLYSRQAFGLALRILGHKQNAEDAVQEAFLRLWKYPTSYNVERGRFETWLLTVVRNVCIDVLKRSSQPSKTVYLDKQLGASPVEELVDEAVPVEEAVWLMLQGAAIRSALSKLPGKQAYFIELAFFKGLTHSQIAIETELPLGTVKSGIRQGLLKLQKTLELTPSATVRV